MNYVVFDEIKCLRTFTKHTTKVYNKAAIYVNELIVTPFSQFGITVNAKDFVWKTSLNVFFGLLGGWVFHIFRRVHSIIWGVGGDPRYVLEFLWIMSHYSIPPYVTSKIELMAENCCWLLLHRASSWMWQGS